MEINIDNVCAYSCLMYRKLCTNEERFATIKEVDDSVCSLSIKLAEKGHNVNPASYYSMNEFMKFLREYQEFVTFDERKRTLQLTNIVSKENIQDYFNMGVLPLPVMEAVCEQIRKQNESTKENDICI